MKFFALLPLLVLTSQAETKTYNLTIKWVPGNLDGYPIPVIGVFLNGQEFVNDIPLPPFPGPTLTATQGDTLEVNIQNSFHEEELSVHWHGIHQLNNPWMDGVDGITECGIPAHSNFTYRFLLQQSGTYHSHTAVQYGDGLFGALIIYPNGADPWKEHFNYTLDYPIFVQDWIHETGEQLVLNYQGPRGAYPYYEPKYPFPIGSLLIGGSGQYDCSLDFVNCSAEFAKGNQCVRRRPPLLGDCNSSTVTPSEYQCEPGHFVRVRLINAASAVAIRFWIDRHPFYIVARDGIDMEMNLTEAVVINVGQRLDLIIQCNQDPAYKYNMYTSMSPAYVPSCQNYPAELNSFAFLKYTNGSSANITAKIPEHPPNSNHNYGDYLLREYDQLPKDTTKRTAPAAIERIQIWVASKYDSNIGSPNEYWLMKLDSVDKSFLLPSVPTLQTKFFKEPQVDDDPWGAEFTTITKVLKYGSTYEVVLINCDYQQHPFHLHGYTAWLVGAGLMEPDMGFDRLVEYQKAFTSNGVVDPTTEWANLTLNFNCTREIWIKIENVDVLSCSPFTIQIYLNDINVTYPIDVSVNGSTNWTYLGIGPQGGTGDYNISLKGHCTSGQLTAWTGNISWKAYSDIENTTWLNFNYSANELAPLSKEVNNVTVGDSWTTPPWGFMVFRITANNLGPWLFHCHMEWHLAQGMGMLFSVEKDPDANHDPSTFYRYDGIQNPPSDFLVCGKRRTWAEAVHSGSSSVSSKRWIVALGITLSLMACRN